MENKKEQKEKHLRRKKKVRSKIFGTADRPRLNVYKSNACIFLQLIDDQAGKTIVSLHSKKVDKTGKKRMELGAEMGKQIAKQAIDKKIEKVVFDRNGYKYHGIVKAIAEAAREAGLKF